MIRTIMTIIGIIIIKRRKAIMISRRKVIMITMKITIAIVIILILISYS